MKVKRFEEIERDLRNIHLDMRKKPPAATKTKVYSFPEPAAQKNEDRRKKLISVKDSSKNLDETNVL